MQKFFENPLEQSIIKKTIVTNYFKAWCKILTYRAERLAYIDLYSGPGYYENGISSTPIEILKYCIDTSSISQKIVTIFNDSDPNNITNLKQAINNLNSIDTLKYPPEVLNLSIESDFYKIFSEMSLIPTFSFIDPFGYKGLTYNLIRSLTKDWGCDCIFFFNYNRINSGLSNPKVEQLINNLFTKDVADNLRNNLNSKTPNEREEIIINTVCDVFSNSGDQYVLPFKFVSEKKKITSHHLIFVTKNRTAYEIMKDIMVKLSSEKIDGVGSFSFIPPSQNRQLQFLFNFSNKIEELEKDLLKKFKGRILTTDYIYHTHNIGTPYVLKNYQDALRNLESKGIIETNPPKEKRRKNKGVVSFSKNVKVKFPI